MQISNIPLNIQKSKLKQIEYENLILYTEKHIPVPEQEAF